MTVCFGQYVLLTNQKHHDRLFHLAELVYFLCSAKVTIHLINQNDNHPKFTRAVYNFNVTENNKPGQIIGVINATDADGDVLSYTWDNKSMGYININIIHIIIIYNSMV